MTSIRFIGQSGVVVTCGKESVVIDPYLSDSVADRFGAMFRRQSAVPDVSTWAPHLKCILLTHAHLDHTDPASIRFLLRQSPQAAIYAPLESRKILEKKRWAAKYDLHTRVGSKLPSALKRAPFRLPTFAMRPVRMADRDMWAIA
jgi:L-ascorbate metabolism protein UlaG (beta-lactamase superfamily)